MSMGLPLLSAWGQNVARDATLTAPDGTVDADFPLASLVDGDQTEACKFTTTTGLILLSFGSSVHLALLALLHHNLIADLDIELRAYASAPTSLADAADLTIAATVGALEVDGFRPNLWFDVDAESPAASYQYWGIAFPNANDQNLIIGEIWADTAKREVVNGMRVGATLGPAVQSVRHMTYGGLALKAQQATRTEKFTAGFIGSWSEVASIRNWFLRSAGRSGVSLLIPYDGEPDVHLVECESDEIAITALGADVFEMSCTFRELSRGLAWD